jgi:hypothetical protein
MIKDELLKIIALIDGWLSDHEAVFLFRTSRNIKSSGEIVEIGSWKGKSTVCLAYGAAESGIPGSVWAVDPHRGQLKGNKPGLTPTYRDFINNLKLAGVSGLVKPLVTTSSEAAKDWKIPVRYLFIDGIHDYSHTKEDYLLWKGFMKSGGLVAFHDCFCGEKGVWKAVDEVFLNPRRLSDIGVVGSILFGIMGEPGYLRRMIVKCKIRIIRAAIALDRLKYPVALKQILIDKFIRLMLLNKYSLPVYI